MTTTLVAAGAPWQQPLLNNLTAEIATEHSRITELGDLTWITNQIQAILEDHTQCSFEIMYRRWYTESLDLRCEKGLSHTAYRYGLGFLVDWLVPRLLIVEGLKHKGGHWLADGLEPLEKFQQMMSEICMYPRTHISHKNYWENWMPVHGNDTITWHAEYDAVVQQARASDFWLRRCRAPFDLTDDLVDLIVSHTVPGLVKEMYDYDDLSGDE